MHSARTTVSIHNHNSDCKGCDTLIEVNVQHTPYLLCSCYRVAKSVGMASGTQQKG